MKIRAGTKRMTLFRFLLAKCFYEAEGIHLDEFIVLSELYYFLKDHSDPCFKEKYGELFERTEEFFQKLFGTTEFPAIVAVREEDRFAKFMGILLPSKQAYFGLKGQRKLRQSYKIVLPDLIPSPKLRPKSYMGVGYRDKGQRRDLAYDGSPHWTEVARHWFELERREENLEDEPGIPLTPKEESG